MKIGVIGIGQIGSVVARKWVENGHEVRVANSRGGDAVKAFADGIGATATDIYGAVDGVDVVFVSIQFPSVQYLPKDLFDKVPADVAIVTPGNYYPSGGDTVIPEIEAGKVEGVWIAEQVGRPVIKAVNNILAHSLDVNGQPKGTPGRIAIAVAGDNAEHKRLVMSLVDELGFDPLDVGSLADSWRIEPYTPAYCCDFTLEEMAAANAKAVRVQPTKKHDTFNAKRAEQLPANATHEDYVQLLREFVASPAGALTL